jgi:hypothetical protein
MENYAGVYTIQNTASGKKYIGSARYPDFAGDVYGK